MCASLSENSCKQYRTAFKRWIDYCNIKEIDMYEASILDVISFLTSCFRSGAQYGTLNTYRSALSLILGSQIGSDDSIKRLYKGFYRLRPPIPKYETTWNPGIVLDFLANFYPNNEIPLEHLTKKTVTLIALVTGHRVQTLSKIKIINIETYAEGLIIKIPDLLKTSRPGAAQPCLSIPFFNERREICPADALTNYIRSTSSLRSNDYLFISFRAPHKAVTSQTISRWIKDTLTESGIDTSIFTAHSTRHASTSMARKLGVSIDLIRRTAGWSGSSNVFAKFYNRIVVEDNQDNFALSILNNN